MWLITYEYFDDSSDYRSNDSWEQETEMVHNLEDLAKKLYSLIGDDSNPYRNTEYRNIELWDCTTVDYKEMPELQKLIDVVRFKEEERYRNERMAIAERERKQKEWNEKQEYQRYLELKNKYEGDK